MNTNQIQYEYRKIVLIISRYLTRQLLSVWLAISGILLVVLLSGRFVEYLNQAALGNLEIGYLFFIILYRIPSFLQIIFPLAFFLSILTVYGRMYAENEMVILEGCGMTPLRLLKHTAGAGFVVLMFTSVLSLWLSPFGMKKTEQIFNFQNSLTALDMVQAGKLEKTGNATYFVEKLTHNKQHMHNVFVIQKNKKGSENALVFFSAEKGQVEVKDNRRFIVLENGYRYDLTPGKTGGRVTQYEQYGTFVKNNPIAPLTDEEALSIGQLFSENTLRAAAEWQWRLSLIFIVPVVVLLAIPLSRVNPRQGRFFKLLPSLLIYLVYLSLLMSMQGSLKHGHVNQYPGLYGINVLFACLGVFLFNWRRIKQFISRRGRI